MTVGSLSTRTRFAELRHDAQQRGFRLQILRRVDPPVGKHLRALGQIARAVDGVPPFGEHKWLRLTRGDDDVAAVLLWRGAELVAAADCDGYHTRAPGRPCHLNAEMVVHPSHRRQGLGALVLAAVIGVAEEQGTDDLHLWAYGNLPAARAVAHDFGFAPERTLLEMRLSAQRLPDRPICPAGLRLRSFSAARDGQAWLALHNRAFAHHPEQGAWEMADLQARLDQPWFNPRDILLLEDADAGQLLGFCWTKLRTDPDAEGEIYIVGVAPSARGRGLGKLLVRAGLAHIRERGRPGAMLYVEADNLPALGLYRELGFQTAWEHVCYAKRLP